MSADNVRGWEIVRKMNIWPRSEASRANLRFWGQSLSQGHYQPTYQQARKGFIYFISLPLIFISQNFKTARKHGQKASGDLMANARDWRVGVNLIGLTKFISTVIGPNLTSCHVKLILVTPLGSKTRKLGAFGSYIPTDCSKTGLERNVFQSQNLQPWNTECVKSGALESGLIFVAFSLMMKYFSQLVVVVKLKGTGFHLALVFTASLSEVENGVKPCRICKTFWRIQTKLFAA